MTFFEWIEAQAGRNDPVGDIARDIVQDAYDNDLFHLSASEWSKRVREMTGQEPALEALDRTLREWEAQS